MKAFETDFVKMWVEDNILFCDYLAEHYDYEMVDAAIKGRLKFFGDKKYPMFSDARKLKSMSYDARKRMAQQDAGEAISVVAIYTNSRVQRVIYNFFNEFYKAPAPARLFNGRDDALEWLKQKRFEK
jgi:hypothetical protein